MMFLFYQKLLICSFFFFSGLLTSYVVLKFTRGEYKNFKYFDYIVLRWCRLTPQLIIFLLITSLLPPLFDGPIWQTYMQPIQNNCYKNWWLNALYLQNFVDIGNIVNSGLYVESFSKPNSFFLSKPVCRPHVVPGSRHATALALPHTNRLFAYTPSKWAHLHERFHGRFSTAQRWPHLRQSVSAWPHYYIEKVKKTTFIVCL